MFSQPFYTSLITVGMRGKPLLYVNKWVCHDNIHHLSESNNGALDTGTT